MKASELDYELPITGETRFPPCTPFLGATHARAAQVGASTDKEEA